MIEPYSFRDFLQDCPAEKFLDDLTNAVLGGFIMVGWIVCLPFAPVFLVVRRRFRGKRMAATWKRRNGYKCPDTFIWWMKYM